MSAPVTSLAADRHELGGLDLPVAHGDLEAWTDLAGWTDAADLSVPVVGRRAPSGPSASPVVAVGIDLVTVSDVADSVERLGQRYLLRIFTPHELASCRAGGRPETADGVRDGYVVEALAARFAAKEAVVKVLRPNGTRPEWRTMEVRRVVDGWCELRLSGLAAAMATEAGIGELLCSLTHEATMAAAVVVGVRHPNRTTDQDRPDPMHPVPSEPFE